MHTIIACLLKLLPESRISCCIPTPVAQSLDLLHRLHEQRTPDREKVFQSELDTHTPSHLLLKSKSSVACGPSF